MFLSNSDRDQCFLDLERSRVKMVVVMIGENKKVNKYQFTFIDNTSLIIHSKDIAIQEQLEITQEQLEIFGGDYNYFKILQTLAIPYFEFHKPEIDHFAKSKSDISKLTWDIYNKNISLYDLISKQFNYISRKAV